MRRWLEQLWYGDAGRGAWLAPLEWLFAVLAAARRLSYRSGLSSSIHPGRPVIVVGNISVGGNGKTPVTIWLANALREHGLRVGILSRGYGGTESGPVEVLASSNPARVGDEPVLIARRTQARVVVGRDRVAAAAQLAPAVDVLVADDGLQHYRLKRDIELAVVDSQRAFGNGHLLPRGPLREPPQRLASVDAILVTGEGTSGIAGLRLRLRATALVPLAGGARLRLEDLGGRAVHAVAGIADPERFFRTLEAAGLRVIRHPKADHAALSEADLDYADGYPVLMTEKDAVKCTAFARQGQYYLEVEAVPDDPAAAQELLRRLLPRIRDTGGHQ